MTAPPIRPAEPGDRAEIERLLSAAKEFRAEEVACALELFDESCAGGDGDEEYPVLCAEAEGGGIAGFACWGKTPLTRATADLYWIATDPARRRSGVGRRLLRQVEQALAERAIALLVAETSSLPSYAQARAFYEKEGFAEESRIRDFYAPGGDRVLYCKRL